MSMSCKIPRAALLGVALVTAFLPFAAPQVCARAFREGLALCGGPLLVSLFPFLVVSQLLIRCGAGEALGVLLWPVVRLIGLRARCAGGVLLIGLVGGFAPAATAAAESVRTGRLTPQEAGALLPACICSGPSFVVLTVGGQMLGSEALGVCLFAAQALAGVLAAAVLCRLNPPPAVPAAGSPAAPVPPAAPPRLDAVLTAASETYLKLCGFVLYFRMLAAGAAALLPETLAPLPAMLLEVCSGCDLAARSGPWASALCCAALSVQGASVLLQVRTICPAEISFRPLLWARVLHLPLSLAWLCLLMPDGAQEVFQTLYGRVVPMRRVPLDCALLVFFFCCFVVCERCRAAQPGQDLNE